MKTMVEYDEEAYAVPVGFGEMRYNGVKLVRKSKIGVGDVLEYLSGRREKIDVKTAKFVLMNLYLSKRRWRNKYKTLRQAVEQAARNAELMGDTYVYDLMAGILDDATDINAVECRRCDSCRQMLMVLVKCKELCAAYDAKMSDARKHGIRAHTLDGIRFEVRDLAEAVAMLEQCDGWRASPELPKPDPIPMPKKNVAYIKS